MPRVVQEAEKKAVPMNILPTVIEAVGKQIEESTKLVRTRGAMKTRGAVRTRGGGRAEALPGIGSVEGIELTFWGRFLARGSEGSSFPRERESSRPGEHRRPGTGCPPPRARRQRQLRCTSKAWETAPISRPCA